MAAFLDGCRFNPSAGGTTDWTYSSAVTGYQSPAAANVVNGRLYKYRAESADLSQWEFGEGAYNTSTGVLARTTILYSSNSNAQVNFSTVPQVALVALKEDLISVEEANTFSATQQAQARTNLGMSTEVGKIEWWPTSTVPAGRLVANGQSVSRTTYPALLAYLIASGTATFTNSSSTVGMTAHNRQVDDPIKLFTTGSLPTNFTAGTHGLPTAGTNYYVASVIDANHVTLAAIPGGTAIVAGSAGSGTQTWVSTPSGDGDGSTTFTVPDLRGNFVRGVDLAAGVDSHRTIGSLQADAFQGHHHNTSGNVWIWNRGSGGVYVQGSGGSTWDRNSEAVLDAITDGTNGTPRTSAETRPRNVALLATIRYSA